MARTRHTKRKVPNTVALPPDQRPKSMPAGKRMPSVMTAKKTKNKGDVKIKFLLEKPKKVVAKDKKKGERREIILRRVAKYIAQKRNRRY